MIYQEGTKKEAKAKAAIKNSSSVNNNCQTLSYIFANDPAIELVELHLQGSNPIQASHQIIHSVLLNIFSYKHPQGPMKLTNFNNINP